MPSNVDWSMIEKYELMANFGYAIPGEIGGKSGITIGAGIDLGRHSWDEIKHWEIAPAVKERLRPYAGKTGQAAQDMLYQGPKDGMFDPAKSLRAQIAPQKKIIAGHGRAAHVIKAATGGLELSDEEVRDLNEAVRKSKLAAIRAAYDTSADNAGSKHFDLIPATCQTAIVSLCFHFGANIGQEKVTDRRKLFWDAVVQGKWAHAIECILSRFIVPAEKAFEARRLEEVILIMRGMGLQEMGPLLQKKLFNIRQAGNVA